MLLLPALAAALALFLFAACVRTLGRLLEPRFVSWTELIAFDQKLGWKPRPALDTHYLADYDDVFRIVTDREGWPGRRSIEESPVVVIGDSFAFGYGMDTPRSFAELCQVSVKAVGAPGYSMVHGVRLMEEFGSRLSGKLVVWFVYLENDLQDNLAPEMRGYRTPFVRPAPRGGWEIVDDHVSPATWHSSRLDRRRLFPTFCVPGPLADRAYAASDYLICRAHTACHGAGAHLVLVTVPHPIQLTAPGRVRLAALSGSPASCDATLPDRRIAESCQSRGIPMVPGAARLSFRHYKRREGIHWNARGHRRMATLLDELYGSFTSGTLTALVPHSAAEPASVYASADCKGAAGPPSPLYRT